MSTPFPREPRRSFFYRHRKGIAAISLSVGTAIGAGYKVISEARAERVLQVPAADVSALRQDIGYLRGDIRDERTARENLSTEIGQFRVEINGRLTRLETIESQKAARK